MAEKQTQEKRVSSCPSDTDLADFSTGLLTEHDSLRIAAHVDSCPKCDSALSTIESTSDSFISSLRKPPVQYIEEDAPEFQRMKLNAKLSLRRQDARTQQETAPLQVGQYRLLEKIGRGGMGVVYKAEHINLGKVVVVKLLPADRVGDSDSLNRFYREMRAVGALDHPHIIDATDAGEFDGYHVLVMEYVEGIDLSRLLRRVGTVSIANACEAVRQAALGLDYIQQNGMVHRDIKPSNLLLSLSGQIKILDLGLARLYESGVEEEETLSGQILGTADYMAPEQAARSPSIDTRADIYSLGCTLYKLLSGKAPFSGPQYPSPPSKILAHQQDTATPVRSSRPLIPEDLAALLEKMLAKEPGERISSPVELAGRLSPFCTGSDLQQLAGSAININGDTQVISTQGRLPVTTDREKKAAKITPSVHRFRRLALPIALVLLLVTATVTAFFAVGNWRGKEELKDPWGWEKLLGQVPQELIRSSHRGKGSWKFDEELGAMVVTTDDIRLIALGEIPKNGGNISIDIRQPTWDCAAGFFLGYRDGEVNGKPCVKFQLIRIDQYQNQTGKKSFVIQRHKAYIINGDGKFVSDYQVHASIDAIKNSQSVRLEVQIDKNGVAGIRFDQQELLSLSTPKVGNEFPPQYQRGVWGVYTKRGTAWFSNPKFLSPTGSNR